MVLWKMMAIMPLAFTFFNLFKGVGGMGRAAAVAEAG